MKDSLCRQSVGTERVIVNSVYGRLESSRVTRNSVLLMEHTKNHLNYHLRKKVIVFRTSPL